MTKFDIAADVRAANEKLSTIRQSKRVPAVVYGRTQNPISLTLDASDFLRLFRKAGGSNIISLSVGKKKMDVLIHSTQKQPVTGSFTHVDFYAITQGESVHAHVHLNFVGESQAKRDGAIIEEYMKDIEVKCLPTDLVDHFDVDVSLLEKEGDVIRVSNIGINSSKYELTVHIDDVVAIATLPRAVVIEEVVADESLSEEEETEESKK